MLAVSSAGPWRAGLERPAAGSCLPVWTLDGGMCLIRAQLVPSCAGSWQGGGRPAGCASGDGWGAGCQPTPHSWDVSAGLSCPWSRVRALGRCIPKALPVPLPPAPCTPPTRSIGHSSAMGSAQVKHGQRFPDDSPDFLFV